MVYDVCACPDHGIEVSGECFIRDDHTNFPTEPLRPVDDPNSIVNLGLINRNYDGANNNVNHILWGSKGSILERRSIINYKDGRS